MFLGYPCVTVSLLKLNKVRGVNSTTHALFFFNLESN
jgi:hypothetical protein